MKVPFFEGELIRKGALVFSATLFASIAAFLANIFISNILDPKSFGDFKTIIYLFAFLPFLVDFGINASLTKYIAEFREERIREVRHLIKWFLGVKILSFILIIALAFYFKDSLALHFLKDTSLSYLIPAGIFLLAANFFTVFNFITLGFQNFKLFSLSQLVGAAASALLSIVLSPFGIFYMILGWGMGPLIGSIPNMYFLSKKGLFKQSIKVDIEKIFLKFSLPIYPVELSTNLFNAIIPLLSLFFQQTLIGQYSFAFMFYLAALLIPNSLCTVLFPKICELNGMKKYEHAKNIMKRIFMFYTMIVMIGLLFVFLFSEQFIMLVAKQYIASLSMFRILVSLGLVFGYVIIYANYLKGLGKVKRYALFTLVQNLILIAVSFVLVSIK